MRGDPALAIALATGLVFGLSALAAARRGRRCADIVKDMSSSTCP